MWTFVGGIFGVVQAAVLMAAVVLGVRLGLESVGVGAPLRLVACILAGLAVYPLAVRWRAPEVPAEVRAVRRPPRATRRRPSPSRSSDPRAELRRAVALVRELVASRGAGDPAQARRGNPCRRPGGPPRGRCRRAPVTRAASALLRTPRAAD